MFVGWVPVNVERSDDFRKGEVLCYRPRHSHLRDSQHGVRGDDSSAREVHTFTHQVTTDTPFFPLQSLLDGLEGAARFLYRLWEQCKDI